MNKVFYKKTLRPDEEGLVVMTENGFPFTKLTACTFAFGKEIYR